MDGTRQGGRLRSFLLGGLVGVSAGAAAARRLRAARGHRRPRPAGLEAFEDAPCYHELIEREAREARENLSARPDGSRGAP